MLALLSTCWGAPVSVGWGFGLPAGSQALVCVYVGADAGAAWAMV